MTALFLYVLQKQSVSGRSHLNMSGLFLYLCSRGSQCLKGLGHDWNYFFYLCSKSSQQFLLYQKAQTRFEYSKLSSHAVVQSWQVLLNKTWILLSMLQNSSFLTKFSQTILDYSSYLSMFQREFISENLSQTTWHHFLCMCAQYTVYSEQILSNMWLDQFCFLLPKAVF